MTPVGISSIAEALSARNIQIALLALCLSGFTALRRFIASSPKGVAALPSPKKFAARFSVTEAEASPASGIKRRSGLCIRAASFSISPASEATLISPIHNRYAPASDIESSTAESAPASRQSNAVLPLPPKQQRTMPIIQLTAKKNPIMVNYMHEKSRIAQFVRTCGKKSRLSIHIINSIAAYAA